MLVETFAVFACLSVIFTVAQPPFMEILPRRVIYFRTSQSVTIPCKSNGSKPLRYTWLHNSKRFEPQTFGKRIMQLAHEGTIVFKQTKNGDQGWYQCFAENSYGTAWSGMTGLAQARFGVFKYRSSRTWSVRMGHKLKLPCLSSSSVPRGRVVWIIDRKHGKFDVKYDNRVAIDEFDNLLFLNVQKSDEANGDPYRCELLSSVLADSRIGPKNFITVEGNEPEKVAASSMYFTYDYHITALLYKSLTLTCVFGGYPTPTIRWNKHIGHLTMRYKRIHSFGRKLTIRYFRQSDAGWYECVANNSGGIASELFSVVFGTKPEWEIKPVNVEVPPGWRVNVTCSGRGIPQPIIKISENTHHLKDDKKMKIYTGHRGNLSYVNIVFENLTEQDSRVFQCNLTNRHGSIATNFYIYVTVIKFIKTPQPYNFVYINTGAVLYCRTSGYPKPVIVWYKNNREVNNSRYSVKRNGDLWIRSAKKSDEGVYRCKASNKYDTITASGRLFVRKAPKPLGLSIACPSTNIPATGWFAGMLSIIFILLAIIVIMFVLVRFCHFTFNCCSRSNPGPTQLEPVTHPAAPPTARNNEADETPDSRDGDSLYAGDNYGILRLDNQ